MDSERRNSVTWAKHSAGGNYLALGTIIGIALYGAFTAIGGRRFFEKE